MSAPLHVPLFRKLSSADRDRLTAHLLRLDDADRRMRFCGGVGEQRIRSYCAGLDWSKTTVLGYVERGELRAVSELVRTQTAFPGSAELALSVEKPLQNQGIGTELLRRALVIARNRYLSTVYMFCLRENQKMQHIARKFGAKLIIHPGEVEARIWPPWPTYLSLIEEAASDGRALLWAPSEQACA